MQTTHVELLTGCIYVMAASHRHFYWFKDRYRHKNLKYLYGDANAIRGLGDCTVLRLEAWTLNESYNDEFLYWLNHRRNYGVEILDMVEEE